MQAPQYFLRVIHFGQTRTTDRAYASARFRALANHPCGFAQRVAIGITLGFTVLVGCATTSSNPPVPVAPRPVPAALPISEVPAPELHFSEDGFAYIDGRNGEGLTHEDLVRRALQNDVILIGEHHDEEKDHDIQARIIRAVGRKTSGLRVGFEMVETPNQEALDRFARDEIDVDGLYAALAWENTWGFDSELYRPIWDAVRDVNAHPIALNAPRSLVRAVARQGLEALDEREKAGLPSMDLGDDAHRQAMREAFHMHHHAGTSGDGFERFYAAQVLWDENMAQELVAALDGGATRVIGLAGNGHVEGYRGIPQRVLRRKPKVRLLTIVPIHDDGEAQLSERVREAVASRSADVLVIVKGREVLSL